MAARKPKRERIEPTFGAPKRGGLSVAAEDRPAPPPERRKRRAKDGGGGPRKPGRGLIKGTLYWGFILSIWGFLAVCAVVAFFAARLPPTHALEVPKRPPNIAIVAMDGSPIANRGDTGGAFVPLKELPPYVANAIIAIEDHRFRTHHGIDPIGLARAVFTNITRRGVAQGGSTLTQQLAKNLFLTPARSLERKVQEAVLALWLEAKYSKDQIVEMYLNRVYFGAGAYGIEAAAQRYFGKSARALTLSEAAIIAGLVKAPSKLNPTKNPDAAADRAKLVIAAMAENGFINDKMAKIALANPAATRKLAGTGAVQYVADWVVDALDDLVGPIDTDIVVTTTIDPALQQLAERIVVDEIAKQGDKFDVEQGAFVAMDPNGSVRALVGGVSYTESQYNRVVTAKRQPGSAFKPFVYLAALEKGLTPDTVRDDSPVSIKGWRPENYSRDYRGPVTLSTALALSLNTVAVKLGQEVGPKSVVRVAQRLGITAKLDPNASIALGTSEVSLLELAGAYAPFANGGIGVVPHVIDRIRTTTGKTLYVRKPANLGRVVEPQYVAMMNQMLSETLTIGTGRKGEIPGVPAAGKTGTSQEFRDGLFVGYTSGLVAAVWLGNDDGSPTKKVTGGGLPVEIWARFMREAVKSVPSGPLPGINAPRPQIPGAGPPVAMAPPVPPRNVGVDDNGRVVPAPRAGDTETLDAWIMRKVFGQ